MTADAQGHQVQNTKAMARRLGVTAAHVNEVARDLDIPMRYRGDNHNWEIVNPRDALALYEHLREVYAQ